MCTQVTQIDDCWPRPTEHCSETRVFYPPLFSLGPCTYAAITVLPVRIIESVCGTAWMNWKLTERPGARECNEPNSGAEFGAVDNACIHGVQPSRGAPHCTGVTTSRREMSLRLILFPPTLHCAPTRPPTVQSHWMTWPPIHTLR